jgi:formate hydrogenlyase subunit 6/NADH:ubiquinone oxidoreductase subunit I
MRKPKIRELTEAIKVLATGPYTSKFPKESPVLPSAFRGKPEFVEEKCIGCGACAQVCPSHSIEIVDNPSLGIRRLILHYDSCNFCGQCLLSCSTREGIKYTGEFDLAGFDRSVMTVSVEKELAVCEICGGAAGARDHLQWLSDRLGSLGYANPTLILADMRRLSQAGDTPDRVSDRAIDREDLFRVLCPACRRTVFLAEEWG